MYITVICRSREIINSDRRVRPFRQLYIYIYIGRKYTSDTGDLLARYVPRNKSRTRALVRYINNDILVFDFRKSPRSSLLGTIFFAVNNRLYAYAKHEKYYSYRP